MDALEDAALALCEDEMFVPCSDLDKPCRVHYAIVAVVRQKLSPDDVTDIRYWKRSYAKISPGTAGGYNNPAKPETVQIVAKHNANAIASVDDDDVNIHYPVFDFDFDCQLIQSATKGHYHLLLNKPVRWKDYIKVMKAMADASLLEKGYVETARRKGFAALWLPGEKSATVGTTTTSMY